MDIWFSRVNDFVVIVYVNLCTMSLDRILSLTTALALIVALVFIAMMLHDLNDLWSALTDYQQIIKSQNDKIRDIQLLVISKLNIGTDI